MRLFWSNGMHAIPVSPCCVQVIGKLHIPVVDIARNGAMKDIWTLQDTERGQVEMVLSWQTFYFEES
eukprot:365122-Chlamydomonas_euryale.AAC.48